MATREVSGAYSHLEGALAADTLATSEARACPHCGGPRTPGAATRCPACQGLWLVDERYELGALLGEGGTSMVYQGRDLQDGTHVTIKVVTVSDARDWKTLDLFERGTAILRGLSYPAIPRVFAFVKDGTRAYQVRDYYAAGNLESLVKGGLRLDRKRVHVLLKALLEVLDYLHTRLPPVLHRDVKPANVMFRAEGDLRPALVDFDAAAADGPASTGTTIVVSPGYSAPEQLAGDAQPASDLYSLGMTMLFVLTQRPPLEIPRKDGKPDVEGVLAQLEPATRQVIARLIQTDVAQRYRSARDALRDLAGLPPSARAAAPAKAAAKAGFFTQKLEIAGVSLFRIAVGVLLGVLVGYLFLMTRPPGWLEDRTSERGVHAR